MSKRQIVVAAWVAMSALSGTPAGAAEGTRPAGALPLSGGWTARLFLEPIERPAPALRGEVDPNRSPLAVNVQLSRNLGKKATVAVEATNLFDREPGDSRGLAPPPEGRGLLLRFRRTF